MAWVWVGATGKLHDTSGRPLGGAAKEVIPNGWGYVEVGHYKALVTINLVAHLWRCVKTDIIS